MSLSPRHWARLLAPLFAALLSTLLFTLLATLGGAVLAATPGQAQEGTWLDVNILLFEPAAASEEALRDGGRELRQAEARLLPVLLAGVLSDTQHWGAVRVLPQSLPGADLELRGSVLASDGARLELRLEARDSSGRVWLDQVYTGSARDSIALSGTARDPFQDLFETLARDLATQLGVLPPGEAERLHTLALLQFAAQLAPESFAPYLEQDAEGRWHFRRLPAADDPLLGHVREIRRHDQLFIDAVDEQYRGFAASSAELYDLWRRFSREQAERQRDFEARQARQDNDFRRGSYRALRESYDNFRWARLQEEYRAELTRGFANEVEPTEIDLHNQVYRMSGSMDRQAREWREILRQLFLLETGVQE